MNRQRMGLIRILAALRPGFLLGAALMTSPCLAGDDSRPNVLFLAVDDLRPELGCYGVREIKTPHMDALAASGVTFTRAYCQQAVCNPSRASLLSGLRPDSTKVWDLVTNLRDVHPQVVTLPEYFKQQGYYTVGMGKIYHNTFPDPKSWSVPRPKPMGHVLYSRAVLEELRRRRQEAREGGMSEREIANRIRGPAMDIEDVPDNHRFDGALAELALRELRKAHKQEAPFFVAVGFILPHLPWTPPKRYWDLYDPAEIPLAPNGFLPHGMPAVAFGDRSLGGMYELRDCADFKNAPSPFTGSLTEAECRRLKHGYYASVSFVDEQIGRLLREVDRLGARDNTIVVLWGDHGWKLGEHNGWCKPTNYEIDTRSPLIVAAPDSRANGTSCSALVEFVDIYPTLCDLAGLPLPKALEGASLVPLLDDPGRTVKRAAFSQFLRRHEGVEYMGYAMRTHRYRYVEWKNRRTLETFATELYDHLLDPLENKNLANEAPGSELAGQLSNRMWNTLSLPVPTASPRPVKKGSAPRPLRPSLRFENHLDQSVCVYFVPREGTRRLVGKLEPGGQLGQQTTIGHRFEIEGSDARFRRIVVVDSERRTVAIAKHKGPSILFLMADDWSWPHAGVLGDPVVKTPTLDRIALEGLVFENAFVSAPSCSPSRMAIASGQWHWRLGDAVHLGGSLARDVKVYPELLEAAGYRIGFSRKGAAPSKHVHRERDPLGPRFSSFKAFLEDRQPDEPFCFWYGAGEPHRPYRAGAGVARGLDPLAVDVPGCLPDNEIVRSDLCDYYEAIQRFDRDAGRIIAKLKELGEFDNTLVVVSGDNGMPFPRCKATLYDKGTHVPLLIRWPARVSGRRRAHDIVSLTDLAPTFLEIAGVPVPAEMTGRSLLSILTSRRSGQIDPTRSSTLLGMERHVFAYSSRAIRTHEFLYVRNFDPTRWPSGETGKPRPKLDFTSGHWPNDSEAFSFNIDPSPTKQFLLENRDDPSVKALFQQACGRRPGEELYDVRRDPHQLRNLADDSAHAQQAEELRNRLEAELRASGDPRFPGEPSPRDRDKAEVPSEAGSSPTAAQRPNVLFIAVDDLNDWVGCLGGHPQARTPHIDRLAASGTLFTNAYCAGASCNPSRTAILTGLPPHRSGLYTNLQKMRQVLPDAELLPRYFSRHGYWSAGSGKILHYFIDAVSWDDYFPTKEKENPFPRTLYPEKRPVSIPHEPWMYVETDWGPLDVSEVEYGGDRLVADWICKQLGQKHDRPFFLACGIYRPHEPWFVPKKYFDMFPLETVQMPRGVKEGDLDDVPPRGQKLARNRYLPHIREHGQWKPAIRAYLSSIAFADAMVGRVLDALEESPHRDSTIVVLWSDHGWHLGEKEHWQKFTGWRVCTRVPLIVRVPEGAPGLPQGTRPGSRCTRPVNLVDLFQTLTALSGLPEKAGLGGNSLVPLLRDSQSPWPHASLTHLGRPSEYAVSTERWRYIHYSSGGEELYDIDSDPHEWTNLAGKPEHAARLAELRALVPRDRKPNVPTK